MYVYYYIKKRQALTKTFKLLIATDTLLTKLTELECLYYL